MQICTLPKHLNWQLSKVSTVAMAPSILELESHSTDLISEGDIGLSGTQKFQHGDMPSNTLQIKSENREIELQFLQHHNQKSLEESIVNHNLTYDTNMTDNNTDDTIEATVFKDDMASQCLMQDIENNFICNPECYRQKL